MHGDVAEENGDQGEWRRVLDAISAANESEGDDIRKQG
jgi:hypothetical protein